MKVIMMQLLTDLNIPHKSTYAPGHGIVCVFPTVTGPQFARPILIAAGCTVRDAGPRGLMVVPPAAAPVPAFRQRHAVIIHRLWVTVTIVFAPSLPGLCYWGYRLVKFTAARYTLTRRPAAPVIQPRRGWVL